MPRRGIGCRGECCSLANPHPLPMLHLVATAQHASQMQWLSHLALHLAHMQSRVRQRADPWTAELTVQASAPQAA